MSDATPASVTPMPGLTRDDGMTPAGLQSRALLFRRRMIVLALNLVSFLALGWGVAHVFGAGGWAVADIIFFACFLIGTPWMLMGLWNGVIGLWVMHGGGGLVESCPVICDGDGDEPIRAKVAVTMFVRNEDPARAFHRLAAMRADLDASGQGGAFDFFILSDTNEPGVAAEEERLFAQMRDALGATTRYRRRERNEAYKAGNVRDFLRRWGNDYELYIPLDMDSVMSAKAMLRMVRIMQKHPRIGILQSLCLGAPAESFFARTFQFGMRHAMRSYTAGASWWHGDACGYWGHNAVIRCAPFKAKCRMPVIPGEPPLGGHILSHDQIEATLMRRAGYETRVLPEEVESFEDNPPTILDFIKRDHRWCNGNMQYFGLVGLKGLLPMSRFQIFAAIAMYFAAPAWMIMIVAAAAKVYTPESGGVSFGFGVAMFFIMFSVSLGPKIAGWLDVALTPGGVKRNGGALRFAAGAFTETLFSILIAPINAFAVSWFMVGLLFGRRISWSGQQRDLSRVTWAQGARAMWPQTLLGAVLFLNTWLMAPGALPWAAPLLAGLGLSIPFTVLTASPTLGRLAARVGLCATPEELAPPPILTAIGALPETRLRAA